jgi:hypothetical protein
MAKGKGARSKGNQPALRVGDAAVAAKTGRTWPEWFDLLDRAGAQDLTHKEIDTLLYDAHGLDGWWAQMVTVGYEQARLGRAKHEKPGGFEVSASKTVAVPVETLFTAWNDPRRRARWLSEALTVRKATLPKSMRITWSDGTSLSVNFYAKGAGKSQVAVQHGKLKDAQMAERVKADWAKRLEHLKGELEQG